MNRNWQACIYHFQLTVCVNTKQSDAAIRLLLALLACMLSVTLLLDKPLLVHIVFIYISDRAAREVTLFKHQQIT